MRHLALLLTAALFCAAGCAPTAQLTTTRRAELPLDNIRRLAIVDRSADPALGQVARAALNAELQTNRLFAVVEPAALSQVALASYAPSSPGIDAILSIQALTDQSDAESWLPKRAQMSLKYVLTDAATGNVLAAPDEKVNQLTGRPAERPAEQVQAELVRRCARDVAQAIAPLQVAERVTLARQFWGNGQSSIARGNKLAAAGDWDAASDAWQQALRYNPRSHAALHNLAVAAEARGDYSAARESVDRALDLFAARLYHETESRIAESAAAAKSR